MLVNEIMPLITAAVMKGVVRATGSEDQQELISEGTALAAISLESIERRGKQVPASSIAYFAVKRLQGGRRSGLGGAGHTDALSPAASLRGLVKISSMDEGIGVEDDSGEEFNLHTCLAAPQEDPASASAREIDWGQVMGTLDARHQQIVTDMARGVQGTEMARQLKISPPRIVQLKAEIAGRICTAWGEGQISDVTREPKWRAGLRAGRERRVGRYERAWRP